MFLPNQDTSITIWFGFESGVSVHELLRLVHFVAGVGTEHLTRLKVCHFTTAWGCFRQCSSGQRPRVSSLGSPWQWLSLRGLDVPNSLHRSSTVGDRLSAFVGVARGSSLLRAARGRRLGLLASVFNAASWLASWLWHARASAGPRTVRAHQFLELWLLCAENVGKFEAACGVRAT